jgi:hypothetical protein
MFGPGPPTWIFTAGAISDKDGVHAPTGYRLADVIGGDEIYVRDGLIG